MRNLILPIVLFLSACGGGGGQTSSTNVNSGFYGGLTISGSNRVPSSFVPVTISFINESSARDGFFQGGDWSADFSGTTFWSLTAFILDDYQGSINGSDILFYDLLGLSFRCQSGFRGFMGNCSGASFNHNTRTVSFVDVVLVGPQGIEITLNGKLNY